MRIIRAALIGVAIIVGPAFSQPDNVLTSLWVAQGNQGGFVALWARVTNQGDAVAPATTASLALGNWGNDATVPALAPGASACISVTVRPDTGVWTLGGWVAVVEGESNHANNKRLFYGQKVPLPQWAPKPVVFTPESVQVALSPRSATVWMRFQTLEPHSNFFSPTVRGDSVVALPVVRGSAVTFLMTVTDSLGYVIFEKKLDVFNSFSTGIFAPVKVETARMFYLAQNYPNPFNPSTTIAFSLARPSQVRLSVFDLVGREIKVLTNGELPAGRHDVRWDATGFPSGLYFARLTAVGFTKVVRMNLVK